MSFVGGKLKLKGGEPLATAGGVAKKKKKSKSKEEAGGQVVAAVAEGEGGEAKAAPKKTLDGYILPPRSADEDRRTEAEKRHEDKVRQLEQERLKKAAAKGYRDRIKDFNEYLAGLSEHHDIPKVGPG